MTQRSGLFVPAALAALFVVPAVALQDAPAASLEESLRRTVLALESLAGLGERIQSGDATAVADVLQATEPSIDEAEQPEQLLSQLRGEVGALEIELDGLHAATPGATPGHTGARPPGEGDASVTPTTGLDDEARAQLGVRATSKPAQPAVPRGGAQSTGDSARPRAEASAKHSFEEPGYAADPLRLAKALYRKGRWDEAEKLLDGRSTEPEAAYWHARCLDKLGRLDEAISAYEALVADPAGGEHAQRAREELEFLRWRRDFEERQKDARKEPGR